MTPRYAHLPYVHDVGDGSRMGQHDHNLPRLKLCPKPNLELGQYRTVDTKQLTMVDRHI